MIGRGVAPASALTHTRILLNANQGEAGPSWIDAAIGAALESTRHRGPHPPAGCRGRAGRRGVPHAARALLPPPAGRGAGGPAGRPDRQRPPQGHKPWTLRLLADQLVGL